MIILIINDIRHTDTEITGEHQPSSDLSQEVNHHSGSSWSKWPHGTFDNELIWAKHLCHSEIERLKTVLNQGLIQWFQNWQNHMLSFGIVHVQSQDFSILSKLWNTFHENSWYNDSEGKNVLLNLKLFCVPILYQKRLPHHQKQGTFVSYIPIGIWLLAISLSKWLERQHHNHMLLVLLLQFLPNNTSTVVVLSADSDRNSN